MHQYRITKYDPRYRLNGAYTKEEWTDVSDVGRTFDGVPLTLQEYERVEQQHIDFLVTLAVREGAFPLTIDSLEEDVAGTVFVYQTQLLEQLEPNQNDVLTAGQWDLSLSTCTKGGLHRNVLRWTLVEVRQPQGN